MSVKKPSVPDYKSQLCEQEGQATRGVKIEWSTTYGPGQPFRGGFDATNPDRALRAGTKTKRGKKS